MINNDYITKKAEMLIKETDEKRLYEARKIDVYDVVEHLGCDIDWQYITPNGSVLGCTFFENGAKYVWEHYGYKKGDLPKKLIFKKGTILIDRHLNESKDFGKENFTVMHECFHWILHKYFFCQKENQYLSQSSKESLSFDYKNENSPEMRRIEYEANYGAVAFLMPQEAVINEFMTVVRLKNVPKNPLKLSNMRRYIAKMATKFGVNFNPMKYRLQELELIEKEEKNAY